MVPQCTACGRPRLPLSGPSLNLAGKPARVAGAVAGVAGALVLLVGLACALAIGGLVAWFAPFGVALAMGGAIALVSSAVGISLVVGGVRLRRAGVATEQATVDQALLALAGERGAISAADAASAFGLSPRDADARLTALAKQDPERLSVEVDDLGAVLYRSGPPAKVRAAAPRVRVAPGGFDDDPTGAVSEETEAPGPASVREERR